MLRLKTFLLNPLRHVVHLSLTNMPLFDTAAPATVDTKMEESAASRSVKRKTDRLASLSGADASNHETNKLLELLCKLVLNNTQQLRAMRSIFLLCYSIPTGTAVVGQIANSMRWYDGLKSQYTSKEEKLVAIGPHHVHAWNTTITYLEKLSEESKKTIKIQQDGKEVEVCPVKKYILDIKKEAQAAGVELHYVVQQQVRYCRMVDTYQKKICRRLEVNFAEKSTSDLFWKATAEPLLLMVPGVRRLPGIAPPGDMERRIQAELEAM
eukprot:TRINITY_DN21468_c0_g3_i3.p2 TRINITY_DN21468_c0_g3~~TRINITY_DN21468_c0_g3_i3.p2  ORF type:complete len:267 (-),score=55.76 TRINITY_DN21468_c0_g3_i3:102-902(-)